MAFSPFRLFNVATVIELVARFLANDIEKGEGGGGGGERKAANSE